MSKSAWLTCQGGPVGWSRLALKILLELIETRSISTLAEANGGVAGLISGGGLSTGGTTGTVMILA
jgi:hypothetical protein